MVMNNVSFQASNRFAHAITQRAWYTVLISSILLALSACEAEPGEPTGAGRDSPLEAEQVSTDIEGLTGGTNDAPSAWSDAVVALNGGGCTGTLVAPDIVLTAGHCVVGWFPPGGPQTCQSCAPANNTTCTPCNVGNPICPGSPPSPANCVTNDVSTFNGQWHPFLPGYASITISFGYDHNAPLATRIAQSFNSPPRIGTAIGGHADMALLGLSGGAVASTIATPRQIHTTTPAGLSAASNLGFIGFTLFQDIRQRVYASGYTVNGPVGYTIDLAGLASAEGGDSGSPIMFGGYNGLVMGVNQSSSMYPQVTSTFADGGGVAPNMGAWLGTVAKRSFCSATGSVNSTGADGGAHRKLMGWYSADRTDNFATTDYRWNGCYPNFDRVITSDFDYGYFRLEGWVANPDRSQPAGTVSLDLYYNPVTADNATVTATTAPSSPWYRVTRLGYIWTASGSGQLALRLWYNPTLQDYFTTTQTGDYASSGYENRGIIGYVQPASLLAQQVP